MIAVSGLLPTPLFYCVRQYRCIWVEARQCLCVMCEEIVYIGILLRLGSNALTLETGSQVQSGSLPSCTRSGSVSSIADEGLLCLHVTFLSPTLVSSSCVALPNFVWWWFVTPNELVKNSGSNYIKRFPCIPIMDTESRVAQADHNHRPWRHWSVIVSQSWRHFPCMVPEIHRDFKVGRINNSIMLSHLSVHPSWVIAYCASVNFAKLSSVGITW